MYSISLVGVPLICEDSGMTHRSNRPYQYR